MKTAASTQTNRSLARLSAGLGLAVAAIALLVAAVIGWLTHGSTILFTLAQDGLAWCF